MLPLYRQILKAYGLLQATILLIDVYGIGTMMYNEGEKKQVYFTAGPATHCHIHLARISRIRYSLKELRGLAAPTIHNNKIKTRPET